MVLSLGTIGARAGWEVRGIELPCKQTCSHDACPLGAWQRWVRSMYNAHPLLHSIAEAARGLVVIADATSEADRVARLWKWADVIFMNNLCFDNEPVDAIHGTKVTTMSKMMHSLLLSPVSPTLSSTHAAPIPWPLNCHTRSLS